MLLVTPTQELQKIMHVCSHCVCTSWRSIAQNENLNELKWITMFSQCNKNMREIFFFFMQKLSFMYNK